MAEEFDIEAMLEAPYKKEDEGQVERTSSSKDKKKKKRSRSRSRDRSRHENGRDKRSKSRDRDRRSKSKDKEHDRHSKNHDRERRSRSRDRDRRDRDRRRSRSGDRRRRDDRERPVFRPRSPAGPPRRRSRSKEKFGARRGFSKSPLRQSMPEITPEERDARTVICMQLSARIRARDLEEFFSSVGKVSDVRLITDNKTRRSKGIAYVEFTDMQCVPLAMGLSGQKLLGVPILVQHSQAEKNRLSSAPALMHSKGPTSSGPMRLYVGSLHFNITEDMLKGIFEPFGKIDDIKLIRDHETGRSQGYGFITFHNTDDAKKALEQLNGFELAGRPMKVGHVTERTGAEGGGSSALDTDEMDRAGIDLGATGRLQLMAKLAEGDDFSGTGFQIPHYAATALSQAGTHALMGGIPGTLPNGQMVPANPLASTTAPPIATQCFMLSNMFDSSSESRANWDQEIRDDVIDECNKHGGVLHIYVDKSSPQGNVYVKCPSIAAAVASVNSLHGRYFAGRVITAAYVPLPNYSTLFPDSVRASQPLMSSHALQVGFSNFLPVTAPIR
ncbi:RNA-binding protein 39-like isoform X1 [Pomacea canaliculata]|uniref:RNA-binding protein 39-like isoform X1 n=1 Tax=Pomacea canaliculata TaxID=400727 RepID=UPI000D72D413|nr:RNA-binding protein 39-like isoform X1 [Pomacea canaliculata]XP_025114773.1 RNA-binding protein 39-like isoform X1 [Pomacea canaliculata]XP_025114774.1 RNA-binding protein 39-like isoform X1 [Pomacea canaliculata]